MQIRYLRDVVLLENGPSSLVHLWLYLIMWIRQVFLRASMKLVCQRFSSPLKVTRRNVEWNPPMNRWIGFREKSSSFAWMTNVLDEREIFEIDVGDLLESERFFCRDSSVWLSKRLSDGEIERGYLSPSPALSTATVRWSNDKRVVQSSGCKCEELNLKPERLLRRRWFLTWMYTEGGDKKAKARLVILVYQHPELSSVPTAAPTLGKMSRHLLLQACALHKLRVHFGDFSSAFLPTSASEEHQELTIKAPPEVGYLFSGSEGKPARYVRLMKSFYGLTSAPRAWWLYITQKCRLTNV